jgi:[acyl-carrier-protein] S-malonyltransferase
VIAFLFPGQGSQQVGMGRSLVDAFPEARAAFDEADAAFAAAAAFGGDGSKYPSLHKPVEADVYVGPRTLSDLCFEGPEDDLMLTENTQPAILTMSVAAARVLAAHGLEPAMVAGHSLGEYSANVVAGTFDLGEAVGVVRRRGRYMQEAVPVGVGAMAAILGLDAEGVRRACEEAAQGEIVSPANINSADQVVIAGTAAAVQRASQRAKALGAKRAIPLPVSAPFHCALMSPAEARLEPDLRSLHARDPRVPIVANVDAEPKTAAWAAIDALVRQVSAPVLWDAVVQRLASAGVTTYVEVGPGRVLGGLVKKIHKGARVFSFATADDLEPLLRDVRPVQ